MSTISWLRNKIERAYHWVSDYIFHTFYRTYSWFFPRSESARDYYRGIDWLNSLEKISKVGRSELEFHRVRLEIDRARNESPSSSPGMGALVRGLYYRPNIKYLYINSQDLSVGAIKILSTFLSKNSSIVGVEIINVAGNDNWGNISRIAMITQALMTNSKVRCLLLNFSQIDDNGLLAVSKLLESNTTIELLDLRPHGVFPTRQFSLDSFRIFIKALLKHNTIRILDLSYCLLSEEMLILIAKELIPYSNLHVLSLAGNVQDTDQGVKAIFESLGSSTSCKLKNLDVSKLRVTNIISLAAACLLRNKSLVSLDISHNAQFIADNSFDFAAQEHRADPRSLFKLSLALHENNTLKKLNISDNAIDGVGFENLDYMSMSMNLEHLDLSNNNLFDRRWFPPNTYLIHFYLTGILCRLFSDNRSLKYLNISHIGLPGQYLDTLWLSLSMNKTLKVLDVSWNRIPKHASLVTAILPGGSRIESLTLGPTFESSNGTFHTEFLPLLIKNYQSLALRELRGYFSGDTIDKLRPIFEYRKSQLTAFLHFLKKNQKRELRDDAGNSLPYLPELPCKLIHGYLYAPFKVTRTLR